jgi:hypothetical protein
VNAWGNYNHWRHDNSSSGDFYWNRFLKEKEQWFIDNNMTDWFEGGGKRRSKSSNKPKKSAKRAKSRRTRRQRK